MTQHKKHAFDLHSQKGVAELLGQVRGSALPASTKTKIRELVLKFAQRGGDAGIREELDILLAGLDFTPGETLAEPAAETESETPKKGGAFGGRPVPTFAPVTVQIKQEEAKLQEKQEEVKILEVVSKKEDEKTAPAEPESKPEPEPEPEPVPTPEPAAEASKTPTAPVATESDLKSEALSTQESQPAPEPEPASAPEPETPASTIGLTHIDRIQEIKREVIALVGNPVNLVSANNEVGKQYMGALLDAMKKNNAGTASEASAAMAKLEEAYEAVQAFAKAGGTAEPAPEPEPTPEPVDTALAVANEDEQSEQVVPLTTPEPEPEPTLAATPEPIVEPTIEEVTIHEPVVPTPAPAFAAPGVESVSAPETATTANVEPEAAQDPEPAAQPTAEPERVPLRDVPAYGYSKPHEPAARAARDAALPDVPPPPRINTPAAPVSPSAQAAGVTQKPAPASPVMNPEKLQAQVAADVVTTVTEDAAAGAAAMKEKTSTLDAALFEPDITDGLEKLLGQWRIFKSSGLFGVGPSGIEHPLYLDIKDESMLSIDRGSFRGATEDIQQSITDYLNGWRFEQGIIYQHTETFEHFLRRVVKRILDKTKRR